MVIPSLNPETDHLLDPQDHVVSQDFQDLQAMVVPQAPQAVKERKVLWGLWASLALQVLLVALALLETQEMLASGDFLDLKVPRVHQATQVTQAIGGQQGQASFW